MRFRDHYYNCRLADTHYLLPYGQSISDCAAGIKINSTGARLWDAVCQGADREALLALLTAEYEAKSSDIPELEKDLDAFLATLSDHRLLLPDIPCASPYGEHLLQIGPLNISVKAPEALIEQYFQDFACETAWTAGNASAPESTDRFPPHQRIAVFPNPPLSHPGGNILVRTNDLIIAETEELYLFLPLLDSPLTEMHVSKDGTKAEIYCHAPLDGTASEHIFHAMRFAFLVTAARHGLYVLHSASLLYRGKAWLFSGPSGAGKSTHTSLWRDGFGTPLINGDLNMLGLENDVPICYGLPWCGTSGISTAGSWPLGGVTFLRRHTQNEVVTPSDDQKTLYLLQRLISPCWTAPQLTQNIAFCERLAALAPIFRLYCTKKPQAAQIMREAIDACQDAPSPN